MSGFAAMRHRITLMREEMVQGAGGRMVKTNPVLADVWAQVEESAGSAEERGDKQVFGGSASFTVRFQVGYQLARVIEWRGARYRISGTAASRGNVQTLTFTAKLMEGSML